MSTFQKLASIDTRAMVEKKGRFNYLSWAHAWAEANKVCTPTRKVYKNENGNNYHNDGNFAWVEVGVIIDEVEHIDMLPVTDNSNRSIPLAKITSMDVNTSIQRSTVKALALHGLGLNVYAGEDLPLVVQMMTEAHCKFINDLVLGAEVEDTGVLMDKVLDVAKVRNFNELEDNRFYKLVEWIKGEISK